MLAMVSVAFVVYKADYTSMMVNILYAVFYVQLPGLLILKLLKLRLNHISTILCTGFFTGWAFIVLQYYITELIHTNILLYTLGPAFSLFYLLIKIRNRNIISDFTFNFSRLSTALCIFFALVLLYAMLNTQYLYYAPGKCESIYMNPDKAYHMGLIDSLSHGWPVVSPWVDGVIIKYHVFTELLMAVPVRLFGVTADFAIFSFNPILTSYVLVLSTYTFFRELLAKPERAGLCSVSVMLANMFLVRSWHTSMAFHFAIINDNAVGYGISGAMLAIVIIKYWYINSNTDGLLRCKFTIPLITVIMLLTGIKGPIALVIVGAVWGAFLLGLLLKKLPLKTILPVLLITAGFVLVYVFVLSGKGTSNGSGNSIFAFATIANLSFFRGSLVALLKGVGIPKIVRLGIMLVVFMIFMLTAFIVPCAVGYIRELFLVFTGRREYNFTRVIVYAAFIVGLVAMFIMNYSGHSQVYFGLVSVFFAPLIAFWFFEDMAGNRSLWMNSIRAVFFISLALTTYTLGVQFGEMVERAQVHSNPENQYDMYLSISQDEYEAMRWVDENTPENALLATDRYSSVPINQYDYEDRWDNRFFLYATYSNRFCYISGSGYNLPAANWHIRKEMIETNNRFYDRTNINRGELAKSLDIDFVVVSKRFNDFGNLEGCGYKLCFSNNDVDIYIIE